MSNFPKARQQSWAGRQSVWLQTNHSKPFLGYPPLRTSARGKQGEHTCILGRAERMGRALQGKELLSWVSEIASHALAPGTEWEKDAMEFDNEGRKMEADIGEPTCQPEAWTLF